ncbi:GWxTD domain-containing protein [Larkinella terrae]|uniref:GWxTD domain-containing protein n=1 Tax=Larkinella terrae TaxID=2025311 RepID=A0A7K0ET52_9BACT|nr:GWxTD domain-containing protein [Larkinella terrae]MRS64949.1 GWxTD domain-containing protein [Larkinella terrae]
MRIAIILLCAALLGACASGKRSKMAERNTNQTERSTDPSDRDRSANRPAPAQPAAQPAQANWRVVSTKARFLGKDSTSIRVYINLTVRKGSEHATVEDFTSRFMLNYVIYPDYNSRERLGYGNIPLTAESVVRETSPESGDVLTIFFDVKKPANAVNGVMLAEITEISSGRKVLNDMPIRFKATKLSDRFAFFDPRTNLPQQQHFVNVGDTVIVRDVLGSVAKSLHLYRYQHDFDPAQSPMNTTPRPAAKVLGLDSAMTVMTNQPFSLPKEGLYYFLEDTADAFGMGLVVADNRFPKITRPEKLIKPILYVSTNTEITSLNNAPDFKKALDRYWLTLMAGDQSLAKGAIKAYYGRVEEANRLFTTYKEGWKTDKGMIYIVLGPPDRVQRSRDREVWVYNQRANVSEINFTFNRKPNQFVEDHYELVRYVEYQPVWYPVVEAWRTGAIRE